MSEGVKGLLIRINVLVTRRLMTWYMGQLSYMLVQRKESDEGIGH